MSRLNRSIVTIASASLLAASAAAAQGTKDIASCKALFNANTKTTTTPSHMYMQEGAGASGGAPTTTEMVRVGGATYVQIHGKWQVSPITPAQMAEQEKENIENAKGARLSQGRCGVVERRAGLRLHPALRDGVRQIGSGRSGSPTALD